MNKTQKVINACKKSYEPLNASAIAPITGFDKKEVDIIIEKLKKMALLNCINAVTGHYNRLHYKKWMYNIILLMKK